MTAKMSLEKKNKRKKRMSKGGDVDMADDDVPKISVKSKGIQKKKKDQKRFKKSRKQLLH